MDKIKNFIYEQVAKQNLSHTDAKQMLNELKKQKKPEDDTVAIIGMSGKFPKAGDLDQYWENFVNGVNCITEFPVERRKDFIHIIKDPHYMEFVSGEAVPLDKIDTLEYGKGSFLKEIDKFDAQFFGIPPREAKYMEPNHRLFLEVAWEAIEDAGYGGEKIVGSNTAVIIGKENSNTNLYKYITKQDPMHLTGSWESIMASRLAYIFDLKGPCMIIDTACSSGLVAIHMASQFLKHKQCDIAIAGGICVSYVALKNVKNVLDLSSVESDDDKVRTFDKYANGTVWGEGVGAVVLKPLQKAINDGDHIHAVIKGIGINNDGSSNGITAPNAIAQEKLLLKVWENAGIHPETLRYIEAHGTGTVLGDPIEFKGLLNAFRKHTNKKQFCGIGSLKTNMGHLVAASGVASLLKVVLSIKNKKIPASINFEEPNPYIDFCNSPLYVNDSLTEWKEEEHPRRGAASSFGFSGTNCHVVIEEYRENGSTVKTSGKDKSTPQCIALSAKSENVLYDLINKYKRFLDKQNNIDINSICYTANTGRGHYTHRVIIIIKNLKDLKEKINILAVQGLPDPGKMSENDIFYQKHKIVPATKKTLNDGEITTGEARKISDEADNLLTHLANSDNRYDLLKTLSELYVKGAAVKWDALYKGRKIKKISLPVYPFERVRQWAEPKYTSLKSNTLEKEIAHPLLDRCAVKSLSQDIYITILNTNRHWVLTDHKIMGMCVVPGTTYLEMARAVASLYYPQQDIELKNVMFLTPLAVQEDEDKEVQTIITKKEDHLEFVIMSKTVIDENEEPLWINHVEGSICEYSSIEEKRYNTEKLTKKIGDPVSLNLNTSHTGVFQFGPRWNSIDKVYYGEDEALVELYLHDDFTGDLDQQALHPAMMDNSANILSQSYGDSTYLPLTYKSFKIFGRMGQRFFAHVRKKESSNNMETITFDITLLDNQGNSFAEITDYIIKKVHEKDLKFDNMSGKHINHYTIEWIVRESNSNKKKSTNAMVFTNNSELGEKLYTKLKKKSKRIIIVEKGNTYKKKDDNHYIIGNSVHDYEKLFKNCKNHYSKIIHCMSVEHSKNDITDKQENSIYSLFHMVRALISQKVRGEKEIILISDYANEVTGTEETINPINAALFGLGKVINAENPHLFCRAIDIDKNTTVKQIANELGSSDYPYLVAYRDGKRLIEVLQKVDIDKCEPREITIDKDNTYLITGGIGSLGLEMAKYLSSKNKVKFALVDRFPMPEKSMWEKITGSGKDEFLCKKISILKEIENTGSKIACYSADICDEEAVKHLIADINKDLGCINGVIHCAGVAGEGFLIKKDRSQFENVLNPKIRGTLFIDKYTAKDNLDFFISFSSITTLFSAAGQGDYTAANSFLDSFAAYRNNKAHNTITINWPAWKDTGMAVSFQVTDEFVLFKAISTAHALDACDTIIEKNISRVIPGELNIKAIHDTGNVLFMLSDEIKKKVEKQSVKAGKQDSTKTGKLKNIAVAGKSEDELSQLEYMLGQIWGNVLDITQIDVYDSFNSLGGDSILATHLLKAIQKELPGIIDISDIFSYPSVVQMAEYIEQKTGSSDTREQIIKEDTKEDAIEKLKGLVDDLENEDVSIEDALKTLKMGRS